MRPQRFGLVAGTMVRTDQTIVPFAPLALDEKALTQDLGLGVRLFERAIAAGQLWNCRYRRFSCFRRATSTNVLQLRQRT